jgi:hypothetical protein
MENQEEMTSCIRGLSQALIDTSFFGVADQKRTG